MSGPMADTALENKAHDLLACSWILFGVTAAVVSLRLLLRGRITHRWILRKRLEATPSIGTHDWLAAFCICVFGCTNTIMTIAISHGLGQKIDDLPPMDKPAARRWSLITVSTIIFNFVLPKFSFAAFIMRLVRNSKTSGQLKTLHFWPWVSCYLSLFYITVVAIWEWAQCQPLSYQWNLIPDTGYCYPARINVGLAVSSSILSATVDLVLVLYPLFHIIPLQMPTRKKLLAGSPLLGGLAASTVSIVKIVHLFSGLAEIGRDPTWAMCDIYKLVNAEAACLLIGGSLGIVIGSLTAAAKEPTARNFNIGEAYLGSALRHLPVYTHKTSIRRVWEDEVGLNEQELSSIRGKITEQTEASHRMSSDLDVQSISWAM